MIIKHASRSGRLAGLTAVVLAGAVTHAFAQGVGNAPGKTVTPPAGAAGAAAPGKSATPTTTPPAGGAGIAAPAKTNPPPAAATAAATPPAANETLWRKVCGPTVATGKTACVMVYDIRTDQGQFVSQVSLQKLDTETKHTLRVILPVGVFIPPGVTLLVDGKGKATEAKFTACAAQPAVCVAEGVVEPAIVDAMRKGNKLVMAAKSGQRKDMSFEISLASFAKVYDGPASATTAPATTIK